MRNIRPLFINPGTDLTTKPRRHDQAILLRGFVVVWLVCLCLTSAADGQPSNTQPPSFKPLIKRLAVFKNGYVFTYREGDVRPENQWAYTTDVPAGVLGAVWGYSPTPRVRVTQLLASEVEAKQSSRVAGLEELLLVNEGAQVRIKTDYSDKILEGTYIVLSPRRTFPVGDTTGRVREINAVETNISDLDLALRTETGTTVVKASRIAYVEWVGQPRWEKVLATKERRLAIKSDNYRDGQNVVLGIAALERGVRWIPAYRLEVRGEPAQEATLELEAMVINDLADITDAEMFFVVGVPHFLFKETLSPLSLSNAFAGVSGYFTSGTNQFSNAIMTQTARMGERAAGDGGEASAMIPEDQSLPAMSVDELFLYRVDKIALKKGERTSLRLFSQTVPCREVFEWTILDAAGTEAYSTEASVRSMQDLSRGIWYALKLKNGTGAPWTTAPVLSFRDWKPLGQDMLTFTPAGTDTIVRVTPATEVVGTHKLEEKGRVRQAIREGGYEYDLVTVEGTISVRNIKKQPINVVITRTLTGETLEISDQGNVSREGSNVQSINPRSTIKWDLNLSPGEKQLRYVYKVYVRR